MTLLDQIQDPIEIEPGDSLWCVQFVWAVDGKLTKMLEFYEDGRILYRGHDISNDPEMICEKVREYAMARDAA